MCCECWLKMCPTNKPMHARIVNNHNKINKNNNCRPYSANNIKKKEKSSSITFGRAYSNWEQVFLLHFCYAAPHRIARTCYRSHVVGLRTRFFCVNLFIYFFSHCCLLAYLPQTVLPRAQWFLRLFSQESRQVCVHIWLFLFFARLLAGWGWAAAAWCAFQLINRHNLLYSVCARLLSINWQVAVRWCFLNIFIYLCRLNQDCLFCVCFEVRLEWCQSGNGLMEEGLGIAQHGNGWTRFICNYLTGPRSALS